MNESIAPFISQLYTWSKHCMWGNTPEPVANGMYSHTHTKRTRAYAHTHTHIHARTRAYAPTRGCARARACVCVCVLNLLCILRCADVKFYIPPPPHPLCTCIFLRGSFYSHYEFSFIRSNRQTSAPQSGDLHCRYGWRATGWSRPDPWRVRRRRWTEWWGTSPLGGTARCT